MANVFTPMHIGATLTLSPTTSNVQGTLAAAGANASEIRVVNAGPNTAFLRWGDGAQTATVNDVPILPGGTEIFSVGVVTNFAAICGTGSAVVYITPGYGE